MSIFSNFFKKEAPLLGLQGSGGGLGFLAGGAAGNPVQVTGGTQTTIGDYLFIEFENGMPGTFTVDSGETEEAVMLLAGGGGGGGCQVGGGGGGGGLIRRLNATLTPGPYSYSVGTGGIARIYGTGQPYTGGNGGDTTLTFPGSHPYGNVTNTAKGGGGGGGHQSPGAQPGGSGGGGGAPPTGGGNGTQPSISNSGWNQYGNPGGTGRNGDWGGGGGGGAAGAGSPSPGPENGGPGGHGRAFPNEIPTAFGAGGVFCGGGGGCRNGTNGSNGAGSPGGGGQGGGNESQSPMDVMHGDDKTGGGGGGRRDSSEGSGRGGTGVIIIRVPA